MTSVNPSTTWRDPLRGSSIAAPLDIMQIPYDLEFVENRPTVQVRAVALDDTYPFGPSRRHARGEGDAFDALLRWVHRMISRHDEQSR
jgi:hypothetical protein